MAISRSGSLNKFSKLKSFAKSLKKPPNHRLQPRPKTLIIETSKSNTINTQYEGDDETQDETRSESFGSIISQINKYGK